MINKLKLLSAMLCISGAYYAQTVGSYVGSTYLTNLTGSCDPVTLGIMGDSDFASNGGVEIAMGTSFTGTWASGLGYTDGPGPDLLCVSLHTEEGWDLELRLSDGSFTAPQPVYMSAIEDYTTFLMYDCSAFTYPNFYYDRRVAEVDFATFTIPAGLTVVGARFTLTSDNAANPDPVGILLLTTTTVLTPSASNNGPLCEGATLQLTIADVNANMTYSWTGPNGFTSTDQNPSLAFTAAAAGTYNCVVTDNATGDVFNLSTTVTANPQPSGTINANTVCAGLPMNFSFTPVAGQTISNYAWNFGAGVPATSSAATPSSTFPAGGSYPVSVQVTNNFGCVATINSNVTVAPGPVPSFSSAVTEMCVPGIFTMTNTTNPADMASFSFLFDNGVNTFTSTSLTSPQLPVGQYDVTLGVVSPAGCVGSVTLTDYLTVVADPIADFYWNPGTVIATNTDINLVNTSLGADTYQWSIQDGTPATSTSQNVFTSLPNGVAGNYEVTLIATSSAGCADTTTKVIVVSPLVTLYVPNTFTPDGDEFNQTWRIHIDGVDRTTLDLRVYNRWGETVWECHDPDGEWDGTYAGSIVPTGEYTWTIRVKDAFTDEKYEFVGHVLVNR